MLALAGADTPHAAGSHDVDAPPVAAPAAGAPQGDTPRARVSQGDTPHAAPHGATALDRSGNTQVGKASFYASRYSGRTMADGKPMRLYSNNAASLTLPLGTTARVTNLQTGMSAVVTIEDRGPYVRGRIIDLSPATARQIGLARKQGIAPVEVTPLTVPLRDGTVKVLVDDRGAAAGDRSS
jgi:rare lipoprotein A